jgi:hypothetical protein
MWSTHATPSSARIAAGGCESAASAEESGFYNDLIVRAEESVIFQGYVKRFKCRRDSSEACHENVTCTKVQV